MIAIIEGCGANIASVQFALERLGKKSVLTHDAAIIKTADYVILPGVGTAQQAMQQLQTYQLINIIRELKQPVLGICLGMQLLYDYSEEGNVDCLGIIPGKIQKFPTDANLIIPHMGWNQIHIKQNNTIINNVEENSHVYFVHSYAAPVTEHTLLSCEYGIHFTAAAQKNNFYGMQFHPERSGKIGEQLLLNFLGV